MTWPEALATVALFAFLAFFVWLLIQAD